MIYIDFETRSEADISEVGAWNYSQHPSTDIICMAWAKDDGDINLWLPGDPVPEEFTQDESYEAHNASFEIAIWNHIGTVRYGFPRLKITNWHDSMAVCAYRGLPLSLEKAAEALGLSENKDKEGHKAMLQLTKPRKPTKTNPDTWYVKEKYPSKFDMCYKYCKQDVNVERMIVKKVGALPEAERIIWLIDRYINHRGVPVDLVGIDNALKIVELYSEKALKEFAELTDGFVSTPSQLAKFQAWLETRGVLAPSLDKATVTELLSKDIKDPKARRALEIRSYLSMSSTKKLVAMKAMADGTGSIKNTLQYHGASTGRVAGRGIQITNFPRGSIKNGEQIAQDIHDMSPEHFLDVHPDPMAHISSALRGFICAPESKTLYAGDFSQIEARIVMWYGGETEALDMFASGKDIYIDMAEYIYRTKGFTKEKNAKERHLGKGVILGSGFGMGANKFLETCRKDGVDITQDMAERAINAYREKYSGVPKFWADSRNAAIEATTTGHEVVMDQMGLRWYMDDIFLCVQLPNGRSLSYAYPKVEKVTTPWGKEQWGFTSMTVDSTKKFVRRSSHGGLLVENIVQATARAVMFDAVKRLEKAKYPKIFSVYDEVVCMTDEGFGSVEEFEHLMAARPKWCSDLPIAAEAWTGKRYRK